MKNVAVIGAGITGITLANLLQKKVNLTIFEKSRGVGGRMSTRRAEPYQFNHGNHNWHGKYITKLFSVSYVSRTCVL